MLSLLIRNVFLFEQKNKFRDHNLDFLDLLEYKIIKY